MKCGRPNCSSSTGIHGGMTFGTGELDQNGYWEFPCRACAIHFDENVEKYKQDIIDEQRKSGVPEKEIKNFIQDMDYLQLAAHPYSDIDLVEYTKEFQRRSKEDEKQYNEFYDVFNDYRQEVLKSQSKY